jgi:hypothetical protein
MFELVLLTKNFHKAMKWELDFEFSNNKLGDPSFLFGHMRQCLRKSTCINYKYPCLGGLYIGARPDLSPNLIWVPTQLISTIGPPFCKVWVHNWVSKYKALGPKWRSNLNDRNELEAIGPMLRNWATSNLDPIPLGRPKGMASFLCHVGRHVGWGIAWVGP